jgi:hypothetical protein
MVCTTLGWREPDLNHQFPRRGRRHSQIFQVPLISAAQVIAVTHTHFGAGAAMVQPFFSCASSHFIKPGWGTV